MSSQSNLVQSQYILILKEKQSQRPLIFLGIKNQCHPPHPEKEVSGKEEGDVSFLLISDDGENGAVMETSNAELAKRTATSIYQHLKHSIDVVRLASATPFFNVNLLPTVRSKHCFGPRFADSRDNGEYLLEWKFTED